MVVISEFLAEASVLIQANTVAFRKELAAALATVPKAIEIPIVAVGGAGGASAAAIRREVAAATRDSAVAAETAAAAVNTEAAARQRAGVAAQRQTSAEVSNAAALRAAAKTRREITQGLTAQAASAAGLRGQLIGANSAFLAATAGAILFGKAIQSAVQFQTELSVFAATTGATADQMKAVSEAAKQLGADVTLPAVSANDAAEAMTELSKAGLTVQESISGAPGVLQLATAAQIDNAAATELAASALNAFGLSGDEAVHVADVLANSANDAQGSITDIGIALQQASAAGRQAGLSLEDTTGILTLFARNGIKGSDAGTLLRTMLIRLINPTDKANEVIERLGLHLRNATGGVNLGFFDEFARKTRNLTSAERDRDAAIITGQDAFRGLSILAREGGVALDAQISRLDKSGTAAEIAAARTSGLAGAAENLKNQLATAGLAIGQTMVPALTGLANTASTAITTTQTLVEKISQLREAATKPIEFVIDLAPGGGEGGGGGLDRLKGFVDDFVSTLPGQITAATANVQHLVDTFQQAGKQVAAIKGLNALPQIVADLNKAGATPTAFNETIRQLQAMEKEMRGGSAETEVLRKSFQSFIEELQSLSQQPDIELPIKIPANVLRGDLGKQAAVENARTFGQTFGPSIEQAFGGAAARGWKAFQDAGALGASQAAAAVSAALSSSRLQAGALASEKINLEFQGASQQDIRANLEKTLAAQRKTVATLLKKPGVKQSAVDEARQNAIQTQDQIDAIDAAADAAAETAANKAKAAAQARTAKAKADAQDIQRQKDAADQAIFDALTGGQNRINLAQIDANATARLSDDIAVQKLIANTASREISIIDKSVKDVKARNAAIAARVQILKAAAAELDRLRKEQADAQATKAQTAREAVTTNLEKKLQLAQIIGKKDPILTAFDALIANERKNLAAAKKADKLDALIKLRQTIKDRNDFLNEIKKDAQDTSKNTLSVFDLLQQSVRTFNDNAGNLIGPNQPFAGPTGFTADIAQFLIRRQKPTTTAAQPFPGKAADDKLVSSQTSLTDAILGLTDVIVGKAGNRSTAFGNTGTGPGSLADRVRRARYPEAVDARDRAEARSGV